MSKNDFSKFVAEVRKEADESVIRHAERRTLSILFDVAAAHVTIPRSRTFEGFYDENPDFSVKLEAERKPLSLTDEIGRAHV